MIDAHTSPPELVICAHHHSEQEPEPAISERWKWMTVLGNAAIGTGELMAGGMSTLSVTADGLHNIGDTATYYMQSENILNPNLSDERRSRLRKISHYIIAASSLGVSAKAGHDLAYGQESAQHVMTVYLSGASLALNSLMLTRLRNNLRRRGPGRGSVHERDLTKHFWAVDIPSAGLAFAGTLLQKYNVGIEQVAAAMSGLVGAFAFRPTMANLSHNCLDHAQAPAGQPTRGRHRYMEGKSQPRDTSKGWLQRITYIPRHAKQNIDRIYNTGV